MPYSQISQPVPSPFEDSPDLQRAHLWQVNRRRNMPLTDAIDPQTLNEARRFNRKLAWAPRFKIRTRFAPLLIQALLRLSQAGGADQLARHGLRAERRIAVKDGLSVPVRIIRPAARALGVVLDIHGGGWVMGNAQMNDALNAATVHACQVAVVSVDYRLVGKHSAIEDAMADCLAAARWVLGGEDGKAALHEFAGLPVFINGESAGGHLAAATLLQLKAWPALLARVKGAVLYYGVYDMGATRSVREAGPDTLVLDGPGMAAGLRQLTPGKSAAERRLPPLSPRYGDLAGMPPALMFAGTLDPLRDDTLEMAARWREAAAVEAHLLPEAPHGFIRFPSRMAEQTQAHAHAWLRARIDEA